jgi:hypothetical protein
MGSTKDLSTLSVDNQPGASGRHGRSSEAGASRLTVWGDVRGFAIRTVPVELPVLTIEGVLSMSLLGNWHGSSRRRRRSAETGVGRLAVWGVIGRGAVQTGPMK